jgi:hypothetical protein
MYNKITLKEFKKAVDNGMKVLHLDCETSPAVVYTHYIGSKTSISHSQIKSDSLIICVQYMWDSEKEAKYIPWEKINGKWDDKSALEEISNLINEADIIVGQNINDFDMKVLNNRLMLNRLTPIDNNNTIDVLKLSYRSFKKLSHKLDYRAHVLGQAGKNKMEFKDWINVLEGKVPVSRKMAPYGCKDVEETKKVFYREFEYYKDLPAKIKKIIKSYLGTEEKLQLTKCVRCNGTLVKRGISKLANGLVKQRSQCKSCGKYFSELVRKL